MDLQQFNIYTLEAMFFINATNNTFLTCLLLQPSKCPVTDMSAAGPGRGIYMDVAEIHTTDLETHS